MTEGGGGGNATKDLVWFILIIAGLWLVWVFTGGPQRQAAIEEPFIIDPLARAGSSEFHRPNEHEVEPRDNQMTNIDDGAISPFNVSPWQDQVILGQGNARNESSVNNEYIEVRNRGESDLVNITGWQLVNSSARRQRADVVLIPTAARLFSKQWAGATVGAVILSPGGSAIITTGRPPSTNRWPANLSFQTNSCVGYLMEEVQDFRMNPTLPRRCPWPDEEPGVSGLSDDCYNFVRRYRACHTPEFSRDSAGYELLDDRRWQLPSTCRAYLLDHFSYDRCLAWHQTDPDFYGDEWRIFLNRTWELWADNRETISLYDNQGKLVDQISY